MFIWPNSNSKKMGKRNKIKRTRTDSGPCGHKYYDYYMAFTAAWSPSFGCVVSDYRADKAAEGKW